MRELKLRTLSIRVVLVVITMVVTTGQPVSSSPTVLRSDLPHGWFDVTDFTVDTEGARDDAPAFNAAIRAAHRAGGGVVYIPPSRDGYRIVREPIRLLSNIHLKGEGPRSRIDGAPFQSRNAEAIVQAEGTSTLPLQNITIENIWVQSGGSHRMPRRAGSDAIYLGFVRDVLVRDCYLTRLWDQGIQIFSGPLIRRTDEHPVLERVAIEGCRIWDGAYNAINPNANVGEIDISRNWIWDIAANGIEVAGGTGIIRSNHLRNIGANGVVFSPGFGSESPWIVDANFIERPAQVFPHTEPSQVRAGITVAGDAHYIVIADNIIFDSGDFGIYLGTSGQLSGRDYLVVGNQIVRSNGTGILVGGRSLVTGNRVIGDELTTGSRTIRGIVIPSKGDHVFGNQVYGHSFADVEGYAQNVR